MHKKTEFLGTESIPKLIVKMSLPATIGMLVMTLYNIIDSIFIGHKVGALGLGAVGIIFPFMMIVISISVGFGIGASSIISRKLGEKDFNFAEKVFENFLSFLLIMSLFMSVFGSIFIDELLILLGANENIFPYAKAYLQPILFGIIFQVLSASMTNIMRSIGKAKTAMNAMIIGAILNIILDYIFLFQFDFSIEGVAYATVISQLISSLYLIVHFLSKESVLKFKKFSIEYFYLKSISIIGFPSFIRQSSMSVIGIIINHIILGYGGDIAIAAYSIIFRIMMLLVMPVMGIMQGSQPIIGYNYGAKKFDRVRRTFKISSILSTSIIFSVFLIIYFNPEIFIRMFTKDIDLINFTKSGLLIMFLGMPFIAFQFISQGYFQAIGKAKEALILSLLRQVICFLPFLFILPNYFGIMGIWMIYPISDFISSVVTYFMIRKEFKEKLEI